jgi:hypothetical protein
VGLRNRFGRPAAVADASVWIEHVVFRVSLAVTGLAIGLVFAFVGVATTVAASKRPLEGASWLLVFVLNVPSGQLRQALQRAVVRCPRGVVAKVRTVLVQARISIDAGKPFRASVLDGPVVVPVLDSGRIARRKALGKEQMHIEHELVRVLLGPDDVSLDRFDGCVDHHDVVVPIRHMQIG